MPMPPIISWISCVQARTRLTTRSAPSSGSRRSTSSGRCVAMPQLHLPREQSPHWWQPSAMSGALPHDTASAPSAMARTTSAEVRIEPLATTLTVERIPSSRRRWSMEASASSTGTPTLSRMRLGAAPVPPRNPSTTMTSAPARAMPLAMAAALWTAAIFTATGFS